MRVVPPVVTALVAFVVVVVVVVVAAAVVAQGDCSARFAVVAAAAVVARAQAGSIASYQVVRNPPSILMTTSMVCFVGSLGTRGHSSSPCGNQLDHYQR